MDATTVRVSAFAGFAAIILDFASQLFSNAQAFSGGSNFRMLLSITAAAFCLSFILHLRAFVVRAQVRGKTFLQLSALALILSILVLMIAWLVAIWMSSNFAIASTGATWLVYFVWGGTFAIAASRARLYDGLLIRMYGTIGIGWILFAGLACFLGVVGIGAAPAIPLVAHALEVFLLAVGSFMLLNG